jgi:hypothetical protein
LKRLKDAGASVTEFREPDLENSLTAIAFISSKETKKITSGISLAFKPRMIKTENIDPEYVSIVNDNFFDLI